MSKSNGDNPSPNGNGNGRNGNGQFSIGNKGGPGNPLGKKTEQLRSALANAVNVEDVRAIAKALIKSAKRGSVSAAHEVLDRIFGKAPLLVDVTGDVQHELKIITDAKSIDLANALERRLARNASGNGVSAN